MSVPFNPVSAPDYLPMEKLRSLQTERMAKILRRAYENVPFYKESFDSMGVTPDSFQTLEDIAKFPFTIKTNLRDRSIWHCLPWPPVRSTTSSTESSITSPGWC